MRRITAAVGGAAIAWLAVSPSADALTIQAYYDSSMTVADQAAVAGAISFYQSTFIDPVTVNILFSAGANNSGGSSLTSIGLFNYADYTAALNTDSMLYSNSVEATGYHSITTYNHNSAYYIRATTANCRALGGTCAGGVSSGSYTGLDGMITVGANEFTTPTVIQHEIDEVLGVGGPGSVLGGSTTASDGNSVIGDFDLFRYAAANTPSFTTSTSATAYFSLNGGYTDLANFNQSGNGDYADFTTNPCRVQSWQVCSSPTPLSVTSPEVLALQAIGYDVAVPEPSALAVISVGLAGVVIAVRRRRYPTQRKASPDGTSEAGQSI